MGRRLPLCACCGTKLHKLVHTRVQFDAPGRPEIGWCGDCTDAESDTAIELLKRELGHGRPELESLLNIIGNRGEGRVVRNRVRGMVDA